MSYLNAYKVGSPLFRTLSEGRMRLRALNNLLRYRYPVPFGLTDIQSYLKGHDDTGSYQKKLAPSTFTFPSSTVTPEEARPLLEKRQEVTFPESHVLFLDRGRVLSDGTVVTEDNLILSESTTDFHRLQDHHHWLSAGRLPELEEFDGRLAVISSPGSDNYFHWTLDSAPRLSLLDGLREQIDAYYIDEKNAFHSEWLRFLNIPASKIIAAAPGKHIRARQLIIPSFVGCPGIPSPEAVSFLRQFMPEEKTADNRRLYISRAGARRRKVLHEEALLPLLKKFGFEIIQPGQMSVAEQMSVFGSASTIVAPHGAELTNLVYCAPGTNVIEIMSPYYLNPCFKQLAAVCGLNHTALIGNGGERILRQQKDAHHVWANITIDVDTLQKALERMAY